MADKREGAVHDPPNAQRPVIASVDYLLNTVCGIANVRNETQGLGGRNSRWRALAAASRRKAKDTRTSLATVRQ
jgi:hypothetical protein